MLFRQLQKAHHTPGRLIGQTDMSDLSLLHLFVQHLQGFQKWREMFIVFGFKTELSKEVGLAFRPVQLIQIDIVRLQTS